MTRPLTCTVTFGKPTSPGKERAGCSLSDSTTAATITLSSDSSSLGERVHPTASHGGSCRIHPDFGHAVASTGDGGGAEDLVIGIQYEGMPESSSVVLNDLDPATPGMPATDLASLRGAGNGRAGVTRLPVPGRPW